MMESLYSEVETFFGGSGLVEEAPLMWGHEMTLFEGKVDLSTECMITAPKRDERFENDSGLLVDSEWGFVPFDEFVNITNIAPMHLLSDTCSKASMPPSPTGSYDSGVSSPGSSSACGLELNPPLSNRGEISGSYPAPECDSVPELDVGDCPTFPVTCHTSTAVDDVELHIDDFLKTLGIEVIDETPELKEVVTIIEPSENAVANSDFVTHAPEVKNLPASDTTVLCDSSPVSTFPMVLATCASSVASKPGRKSKITCTEEKKQRKRDQNKNAATRYRERKRQEASQRGAELEELESRNKSLKDQVTQTNKEIDYLRELMVEVYTLSGLIS